ncbi:MAG: 30S ribosomal protein S7 [Holosporales bacterium]|jgi:small subunit ribosomal protein S7
MSRRRAAQKREVLPDPKFGDVILTRFANCLMLDGKKFVAQQIVYSALDELARKTKRPAQEVFHEALKNVAPYIEVRSRRVGGATYQVPMEVRSDRATALATRWIINAARNRSEKTMTDRLLAELLDAANNRGSAVKKREDTHKMAEANKAFAHFKW